MSQYFYHSQYTLKFKYIHSDVQILIWRQFRGFHPIEELPSLAAR